MKISPLTKIDDREINNTKEELLCFVAVNNEALRIEYFLRYYRELGIDRFFIVDNASTDGTREYLLEQDDCHCFNTDGQYFVENIEPPAWTNALANVFGTGHWCLTVDADELLVYPHIGTVGLRDFCRFLDQSKAEALHCTMVDMYPGGPLAKQNYEPGESFIKASPYFDPWPGWLWPRDGECPPVQMFGGVRERVFWKGENRNQTPPCLNKVPLVKWKRGMKYLVSMHFHSGARLSTVTGNLLHFKFLRGFSESSQRHVAANPHVVEKSLQERAVYLNEMEQQPDLSLKFELSRLYQDENDLIETCWMNSTLEFDEYAAKIASDDIEVELVETPVRSSNKRR